MKSSSSVPFPRFGVSTLIPILLLCGCSIPTPNTVTNSNPTHGNSTITISLDTAHGGIINVTVNDSTPNSDITSVELWVHDTSRGGTNNLIAVEECEPPSDRFSASFTSDTYINYLSRGPNILWATAQFGGFAFAPDLISSSITVYY